MKQADKVLPEPFACDPVNQEIQCQLYFNIWDEDQEFTVQHSRYFVKNQCRCALNGESEAGFCSSVIGTQKMQRALNAL